MARPQLRAEKVARLIAEAVTPPGCALFDWEIMDHGTAVAVGWFTPDGCRSATLMRLA